jgi:hypothetical protein
VLVDCVLIKDSLKYRSPDHYRPVVQIAVAGGRAAKHFDCERNNNCRDWNMSACLKEMDFRE